MLDPQDTITLEDGFTYFDPRGNLGAFSSNDLRKIADELDEKNRPWQEEIDEYFRTHPMQETEDNDLLGSA